MNPELLITAEQSKYEKVVELEANSLRESEADPTICLVLWLRCTLLLGEVWKL